MDDVSMAQREPDKAPADYLDLEEIRAAFARLSAVDKLKLDSIAAVRARGTSFKPRELFAEALRRIWTGDRQCPRDVAFMAFLVQTMRSIASHDRERRHRVVELDAQRISDGEKRPAQEPMSEDPNPEEHLGNHEILKAIFDYFKDDEEVQLVLLGLAEGLRGKPLRDAAALDQSQLDYAMKRIRKHVRQIYPSGWKQ